jgi:hypothetical protein
MRQQPTLQETQAWLQRALLFPERVDAAEATAQLEPCGAASALEQLGVYQRNYRLRLESCLRDQFPVLCHALGPALFTDFAREYLRACPPESYTLHDLGRRLADHLERERPDREAGTEPEPWFDFMVDLARFERQLFVLFDAEGHEERPLATPGTPDERLELGRGLVFGEYRFAVGSYHHAVRQGRQPRPPAPERSWIALVRRDYATQIVPIGAMQHELLALLRAGAGVGEALERAASGFGISRGGAEKLWREPGGTRDRWIAAGFFVVCDTR